MAKKGKIFGNLGKNVQNYFEKYIFKNILKMGK